MVRIYRDAITRGSSGAGTEDTSPRSLKERIKALAYGGITAGHFLRGLKE
jgi:hypothetical protein